MFSYDNEPTLNTFLARNRGNEPGDSSRVVFILLLDLLTRQMLGDLFLKVAGIICLISKVRTHEAGTSSGISQQLYQ